MTNRKREQPNRERGLVHVVKSPKGYLAFQIPMNHSQYYFGQKQKCISFGAKYTKENNALAESAAVRMQKDMEAKTFNPADITSYKHPSKQIKGDYQRKIEGSFNVLELYQDYEKNLNVGITTLNGVYKCYHNHIKNMESSCGYTLKQQLEIKGWIQSNVASTVALSMLSMFNRLIDWGKREERLPDAFNNKFKDYAVDFKKSLRTVNTDRKPPKSVEHLMTPVGIKAWSEEERDIIIAAYYERKGYGDQKRDTHHMATFMNFLFNVGCRHGEAFALTWSDINNDFTEVSITESYSSRSRIIKGTKTGKTRLTPLNSRMQKMLKDLKPVNASLNDLIFKNSRSERLSTNQVHHYWHPKNNNSIIGNLIKEGKLSKYYDAYSTRRTFISLQISKGASVVDVAYWVGDKPETILKYYARHNDKAIPY